MNKKIEELKSKGFSQKVVKELERLDNDNISAKFSLKDLKEFDESDCKHFAFNGLDYKKELTEDSIRDDFIIVKKYRVKDTFFPKKTKIKFEENTERYKYDRLTIENSVLNDCCLEVDGNYHLNSYHLILKNVKANNADFDELTCIEAYDSDLKGSIDFIGQNKTSVLSRNCDLDNSTFSEAQYTDVDIDNKELHNITFVRTDEDEYNETFLKGVKVFNADLTRYDEKSLFVFDEKELELSIDDIEERFDLATLKLNDGEYKLKDAVLSVSKGEVDIKHVFEKEEKKKRRRVKP